MTTERLFVYGSLKRGGRHHAELAGARFLGEAVTLPGYSLVPLGEYLALVPESGAASVVGELFELDESRLFELDEFEGPEYVRGPVEVAWPARAGGKTKALAYFKRAR